MGNGQLIMRQLLLDRSLTSVLLHREYDSEPGEHKRNHEKLQPVHPDCFPKLAWPANSPLPEALTLTIAGMRVVSKTR
jgi:hypothetical protein